MKVFFDTNVHVADALLGRGATRMLEATRRGKSRMFTSQYVLDEVGHVLVDDLGFSKKLAALAQRRIIRRFILVGAVKGDGTARSEGQPDSAGSAFVRSGLSREQRSAFAGVEPV